MIAIYFPRGLSLFHRAIRVKNNKPRGKQNILLEQQKLKTVSENQQRSEKVSGNIFGRPDSPQGGQGGWGFFLKFSALKFGLVFIW
jgi:hypothetical protein